MQEGNGRWGGGFSPFPQIIFHILTFLNGEWKLAGADLQFALRPSDGAEEAIGVPAR